MAKKSNKLLREQRDGRGPGQPAFRAGGKMRKGIRLGPSELKALQLLDVGLNLVEISEAMGITRSSVIGLCASLRRKFSLDESTNLSGIAAKGRSLRFV